MKKAHRAYNCRAVRQRRENCSARTVQEEDLHAAIVSAVNTAYASREEIIPVLKENIKSVVGCDVDEEIEVIDALIRKSQKDLLEAGRDEDKVQAIGEKILRFRCLRSYSFICFSQTFSWIS